MAEAINQELWNVKGRLSEQARDTKEFLDQMDERVKTAASRPGGRFGGKPRNKN